MLPPLLATDMRLKQGIVQMWNVELTRALSRPGRRGSPAGDSAAFS